MLLETEILDPLFELDGVPQNVSVTYHRDQGNQGEIHVPVYATSPVFAPPFLIPKGTWTVVFEVQTSGWVFGSVTYQKTHDGFRFPQGVLPLDSGPGSDGSWRTVFDTTEVTDVNMLGCTIVLNPDPNRFGSEFIAPISGDPTIAVVKDPMG
ncbi:MAG TPA: hypothetical protein VF173_26700 [Thermoanaerobaculia bacterium]|nr:hypothetical protein [Thermoanaerobaculia bacterium]